MDAHSDLLDSERSEIDEEILSSDSSTEEVEIEAGAAMVVLVIASTTTYLFSINELDGKFIVQLAKSVKDILATLRATHGCSKS